jgi:hypothetical protein
MSAVAGFPSLSQLLAWPTEHLTGAAGHWEAVGGRSYGVASQVWRDALSVDWHGASADALRTATHADMLTTGAVADQLQAAANVARSGAADLYAARSRVRYAVDDARTAGFNVGQDLSVADRSTVGSAAQRLARQTLAQAFAADVRQRGRNLSPSISRSPEKSPRPWPESATPFHRAPGPNRRPRSPKSKPSTTTPSNRIRHRRTQSMR